MTIMDNCYALVVGIARYQKVRSLPMTVLRDAQDIYDLLVNPNQGGYPEKNVKLLLDAVATKSALLIEMDALTKRSNADSTVFIYFSSHGGRTETAGSPREYLLPVDVDATSDD